MSKEAKEDKIEKSVKKKKNGRYKITKILNKDNKKFISFIVVLALGISLIPIGIVLGLDIEKYSDNQMVKDNFPTIILSVKHDFEKEFDILVEEMRNDPLNGLFVDKLPSSEEIFYEEWANDRFPSVDIPTVGGYIESVGAKAVGDINLDEEIPEADLNISSSTNPSGITQEQCNALWDLSIRNSLVYSSQSIWFGAAEGNQNDRDILKESFNLTEAQLNFTCNWITTGQNSWLLYLAREDRLTWNPLLFLGLVIPGGVLIGYSTPKVIHEIKDKRKGNKTIKSSDLKSKS